MRKLSLFLIAISLGWPVLAISAQWPQQSSASPSAAFQKSGMSLDQAVAMVQAKYGARVMRANTVEENGHTVHYIRLVSADRARVWTVRVDAASGREF